MYKYQKLLGSHIAGEDKETNISRKRNEHSDHSLSINIQFKHSPNDGPKVNENAKHPIYTTTLLLISLSITILTYVLYTQKQNTQWRIIYEVSILALAVLITVICLIYFWKYLYEPIKRPKRSCLEEVDQLPVCQNTISSLFCIIYQVFWAILIWFGVINGDVDKSFIITGFGYLLKGFSITLPGLAFTAFYQERENMNKKPNNSVITRVSSQNSILGDVSMVGALSCALIGQFVIYITYPILNYNNFKDMRFLMYNCHTTDDCSSNPSFIINELVFRSFIGITLVDVMFQALSSLLGDSAHHSSLYICKVMHPCIWPFLTVLWLCEIDVLNTKDNEHFKNIIDCIWISIHGITFLMALCSLSYVNAVFKLKLEYQIQRFYPINKSKNKTVFIAGVCIWFLYLIYYVFLGLSDDNKINWGFIRQGSIWLFLTSEAMLIYYFKKCEQHPKYRKYFMKYRVINNERRKIRKINWIYILQWIAILNLYDLIYSFIFETYHFIHFFDTSNTYFKISYSVSFAASHFEFWCLTMIVGILYRYYNDNQSTRTDRQMLKEGASIISSLSDMHTELSNQNNQNVPQQLVGNNGSNEDNGQNDTNENTNNSDNYNHESNQNNSNGNPPANEKNRNGFYCNFPAHSILASTNRLLTFENDKLKKDKFDLQRRLNQQIQFSRELATKFHQEKQLNSLMKIDLLLDKYYKSHGINNYFINGKGKLSQYVVEKQINDGEFSLFEEFKHGNKPKRIVYSDFDAEFPLPKNSSIKQIDNHEKIKNEIIFNIVQHCYLYNVPPNNEYVNKKYIATAFTDFNNNECSMHGHKNVLKHKLTNLVQAKNMNSESTILNQLYDWMNKFGMEQSKLTHIIHFLQVEEYDTDAVAIDILQTERYNSNMANKLTKPYEYSLLHRFMQRNTKNCLSFPRDKIKFTSNLTNNIVPKAVRVNISNLFNYMRQFTSIYSNAIIKCNDELSVIDFNFFGKQTQNKLYAIADRNGSINPKYFVWKVREEFYTANEIEDLCKISKAQLNQPVQMRLMIMQKLQHERDKIKSILEKEQEIKRLFSSKSIKWDGERVRIYNKKSKSAMKRSLKLNKVEFSTRVTSNNMNNIQLVSIVTFGDGKYHFENVWIVTLYDKITVAISLKLTTHRNTVPLLPKAIYLDISDSHELCCEQLRQGCHCLDNFICNMDELRLESEYARLLQKNNLLETNLYKAQSKLKWFEDISVDNSVTISEKNMRISELENKLDDAERMMKTLNNALQTGLKQLVEKQKEDKTILDKICNEFV